VISILFLSSQKKTVNNGKKAFEGGRTAVALWTNFLTNCKPSENVSPEPTTGA
jgi:hypothetical protein